MSISQAIRTVVKAQKTGGSAIGLVRKLWSNLPLSDSDIETLAQQALANRVSAFHTGPKEIEDERSYQPLYREPSSSRSESEPHSRIAVTVLEDPTQTRTIDISIRVLHTTNYDINGRRKSFIEFTLYDLRYTMDRYQQQIEGHTRHFKVMKDA